MKGPSQTTRKTDIAFPISKKPIWTVDDLAMITGYKKQTIYNKVNSKELPFRRKGGRLFFFPQEILNWIDEGELE